MALRDLFKKFWVQTKLEDVNEQYTLPKNNVSNLLYYTKNPTRIKTVIIYSNENNVLVPLIQDDGYGNLIALRTGILSTATGSINTVVYATNQITITWDSAFISSLVSNPQLRFKYVSTDKESHVELLDLLGEVFDSYKKDELDSRLLYYDTDNIPSQLLDDLASNHNWVLDEYFSSDDSYFRLQLKNLFNLYKSTRRTGGISFVTHLLQRRISLINLLAKDNEYGDFTKYVNFYNNQMFDLYDSLPNGTTKDSVAGMIDTAYNNLKNSTHYMTKHFIMDLALDMLTTDGNLLNTNDFNTLKYYILNIKAHTQFPHFYSYLGLNATASYTTQNSLPFLFALSNTEISFYISNAREIYAGPSQVESIATTSQGAWILFPLLMNTQLQMNTSLVFNMDISTIVSYYTSFQVGKGAHTVISPSITALADSFHTSNYLKFTYIPGAICFELILNENEANDYPITEVGIFNAQGKLAFYIKHPPVYKNDTHKHSYRLRVNL